MDMKKNYVKKIKGYRYRILAMLFFATSINYFDRSLIGVMAPTLEKLFHWTNEDYAMIMVSFKLAYAIGLLGMGNIIDKLGTKKGYMLSIGTWSIFGMLHAAIRPAFSLWGFIIARFGLGIGESGNFPSAIKAVAEWFPKKERALATGVFNAATSVGSHYGTDNCCRHSLFGWQKLANTFFDNRRIEWTMGAYLVENIQKTRGASQGYKRRVGIY